MDGALLKDVSCSKHRLRGKQNHRGEQTHQRGIRPLWFGKGKETTNDNMRNILNNMYEL